MATGRINQITRVVRGATGDTTDNDDDDDGQPAGWLTAVCLASFADESPGNPRRGSGPRSWATGTAAGRQQIDFPTPQTRFLSVSAREKQERSEPKVRQLHSKPTASRSSALLSKTSRDARLLDPPSARRKPERRRTDRFISILHKGLVAVFSPPLPRRRAQHHLPPLPTDRPPLSASAAKHQVVEKITSPRLSLGRRAESPPAPEVTDAPPPKNDEARLRGRWQQAAAPPQPSVWTVVGVGVHLGRAAGAAAPPQPSMPIFIDVYFVVVGCYMYIRRTVGPESIHSVALKQQFLLKSY